MTSINDRRHPQLGAPQHTPERPRSGVPRGLRRAIPHTDIRASWRCRREACYCDLPPRPADARNTARVVWAPAGWRLVQDAQSSAPMRTPASTQYPPPCCHACTARASSPLIRSAASSCAGGPDAWQLTCWRRFARCPVCRTAADPPGWRGLEHGIEHNAVEINVRIGYGVPMVFACCMSSE